MSDVLIFILIFAPALISILLNFFYLMYLDNVTDEDESFFATEKYYYTKPISVLTNEIGLNKCGVVIAMIAFQIIMLCGELVILSIRYLIILPIAIIVAIFCTMFQRHDKHDKGDLK